VVVLGLGFFILGGGQSASTAPAPAIKPLHPVAKKAKARATQTAAKKAKAAKKKVHLSNVPTAVRKARHTKVTDGMPVGVSAALAHHPVVVVSLIAPDAPTDELAYEEAKAGARQAHAGFVRISVANNDDVQALSTLVGSSPAATDRLLDAPAVFVLRRPHDLFIRFNGFVDAATVAQAAANAAPAHIQSGSSPLANAWVVGANAVCRKIAQQAANAPLPTSTAQYVSYLRRLLTIARSGVAKIRTLKPPPGRAMAVNRMLDSYDAMLVNTDSALTAAEHGNLAALKQLEPKIQSERVAGDSIAASLGANDCAGRQ
jgi:hypothetical protein